MKKRFAMEMVTDRLSDLTDMLLLYIMSFLKAREVVRTCVLSKRWRVLWAYLPCLDFDSDEFGFDTGRFLIFVNSFFILRRTSHLDSFRLSWNYHTLEPRFAKSWISTWLCRVSECFPKRITIDVIGHSPLKVPDSIFNCSSVELMDLLFYDMKFENFKSIIISLPSLKRLKLLGVALSDGFLKKLLSGCTVLEELVMEGCELQMSNISSRRLKSLVIKDCFVFPELHISTPSLVSLQVVKVKLGRIWSDHMPSLVKAHVSNNRSYDQSWKKSEHKLLNGFSNATHLKLIATYGMEDFLEKELPKCLTFENLRSLSLGKWCMNRDFHLIEWFIRLSPNLVELILHHKETKEVSILVLPNYSPPIAACAMNEVLALISSQNPRKPTIILPLIAKTLIASRFTLYGAEIGAKTDFSSELIQKTAKPPSDMKIYSEAVACLVQMAPVLNIATVLLFGSRSQGQSGKSNSSDLETMCNMGDYLAGHINLEFRKEMLKEMAPGKARGAQEPWRELYG